MSDMTVVTSENLAEFNAARMGVSSAPTPAAAVEPTEPAVPAPSEDATPASNEAKQQDEQKHDNPKLEKRFSELTKQREDAKREAAADRAAMAAMEARMKDMEAKQAPAKAPPSDDKPQPGQFTDAFEYAEKLAEWAGENALKNRDKQLAADKATKDRDDVVKAWTGRQDAAKVELPDYEETIASSTVQVSDQIRDAILESDAGPQILYHLAKNPDVAKALASKSASSAMREIGRLEATLSGDKPAPAKPVETPSRAPAPITPIRGTKAVTSPINSAGEVTGSYDDFKRAWSEGKFK